MDDRARALALHRARLLALPPAERVDAILAAQRPGEMLRLLPAQEFFLTLVEAGLDRALPLLGLATTHQVEFLFDISSWERDRFEAAPAGHWLGVLHESDPEVVVRWLQEADEDLVVTTLLRLLHVYKLDESTDRDFWPPDRPLSTLDGLYYIEPRDDTPEAAGIALWEGLTRLRSRHRPAYEALLEQVLWAVPPELEERAYERRSGRLAEKGFPELDEAMEVWAAEPETARRLRTKVDAGESAHAAPAGSDERDARLPAPLAAPGLTRLGAAARRLPAEARERLLADLVRLGNRFSVASLGPLSDPDTHHAGLETALGAVNIGLAEIGTPAALAHVPVFEVSHAGIAAVMRRVARARALATGWLQRVHLGRERLDVAWRELLDGLLAPRPLFAIEGEERPFRSEEDLAATDRGLSTIEALGAFLEQTLEAGPGELPELDPLPLFRAGPRDVDWISVAITTVLRSARGEPARPAPFRRAEAGAAIAAALPRFAALCADLRLGPTADELRARLEDEAGNLPPGAEPDPRLVPSILFLP